MWLHVVDEWFTTSLWWLRLTQMTRCTRINPVEILLLSFTLLFSHELLCVHCSCTQLSQVGGLERQVLLVQSHESNTPACSIDWEIINPSLKLFRETVHSYCLLNMSFEAVSPQIVEHLLLNKGHKQLWSTHKLFHSKLQDDLQDVFVLHEV